MALTKTPISLNFSQGLDTKTSPYQVQMGKMLSLVNGQFNKQGDLTKRFGNALITTLPNALQTTLTTLNNNLIATGSSLYAFSQDSKQWLNQGSVQPVSLNTLPLVRVSTSQTSPDTAIASNGLACLVYIDNAVGYYQVSDSATGQQIIARTAIESTATNPRVFVFSQYFIITYMATISAATHMRYIAIPYQSPSNPIAARDLATTVNSLTTGYDAYSTSSGLYYAWSRSSTVIDTAVLTLSNIALNQTPTATAISGSHTATIMSVYVDPIGTAGAPLEWVSWYDGTSAYTAAVAGPTMASVLAPTAIATSVSGIIEMTSTASTTAGLSTNTVIYETLNHYSDTGAYPTTGVKTDYISSVTCTGAGTVGSIGVIRRSVGLASKSFIGPNNAIYFLVTYGELNYDITVPSPDQYSYFLLDVSGNIYMRLAYTNGGGYEPTQVLPTVSLLNNQYYVPYLVTDLLQSVNTGPSASGITTSQIYTQTGVNLASFSINNSGQYSSEIAGALHLTGGQMWEYDGVKPVELGFHVWPDNVAGSTSGAAPTPTGTWANGATSITVSSATGLFLGMGLSDTDNPTYIPAGTVITSISGTTIGISKATIHSAAGDNLLAHGNLLTGTYFYQFCYEWTDNQGNLHRSSPSIPFERPVGGDNVYITLYVPTLRLTAKLSPNPVRIVGYRWSAAQEVFYQFTSITNPALNDTTVDYVTIVDTAADASILGNVILYTTGGVIENIAPPAAVHTCLFNSRLWLIDAEDRNLLWFSKQVIESTPVEMSDLLTVYVAPTTGAQGSTGPMTALSAMDDKLIIFKKSAVYYINGIGPDNTGNNSQYSDPVYITGSVGCANPNSIVLMPNGLMFQSDKGIWILGRDLSTQYIGAPVEQYNSNTVMSAQAIPGTNQVRFVLNNNMTLVYDYYYGQWFSFTNISALSSTLYYGFQTYLNSYGQVLQETPNTWVDNSTPVLMSFTTAWVNAAGLQGYERFYACNLLGTYFSPFTLNVGFSYDYNNSNLYSPIVKPDNFSTVYGGDPNYGSGNPYGGNAVFTARVFPAKQKCQSFQLTVNEVYDSSFGVAPGQGLTFSGLLLLVGIKKGSRTQSAAKSFG